MVGLTAETTFAWGRWYIEQHDLAVLLLAVDNAGGKMPPANCRRCDEEHYDGHDRETCPCLLCHSFYAATKDLERLWYMCQARPDGYLAVRTGRASRVVVIDAESRTHGGRVPNGETYGVDAIDVWELLTGWSLPTTLATRTVTGGLHLFYRLPPDTVVAYRPASKTKIPGVEVKGEDGYVAVPCGRNDRGLLDPAASITPASDELLAWLRSTQRRGRSGERFGGAQRGEPPKPFGPGSRHAALVSLAGTMRTRPEFDADAIEAALLVVNRKWCVPPHDEAKIRKIAESAETSWNSEMPAAPDLAALEATVRRWFG
jgi:hypothetical protein